MDHATLSPQPELSKDYQRYHQENCKAFPSLNSLIVQETMEITDAMEAT